jgi:uncharacterized protein
MSPINQPLHESLRQQRTAVIDAARRHKAHNLRVFGSVARGAERSASDIDILVDALPGATLFDLGALQVELEELLGAHVDLVTPGDLPMSFRNAVLAEAVAI